MCCRCISTVRKHSRALEVRLHNSLARTCSRSYFFPTLIVFVLWFFSITSYMLVRLIMFAKYRSLANRYPTSICAGTYGVDERLLHDIWAKRGLYSCRANSMVVHTFTRCAPFYVHLQWDAVYSPFQDLAPPPHYWARPSVKSLLIRTKAKAMFNNRVQVGRNAHRLARVELMESQILQKSQPDLSNMQERLLDKWYPPHPLACTHGIVFQSVQSPIIRYMGLY